MLLVWAGASTAAAAVSLESADPPSGVVLESTPERVRIVYPASVESAFLVLEVVSPDGDRVSGPPAIEAGNPAAVAAELDPSADDRLTVGYGALTEDGNVLGGVYSFSVGESTIGGARGQAPVQEPPQAVLVLAQLLILMGPVIVLGALVVRSFALEPASRSGGVAPPRRSEERDRAAERLRSAAAAGGAQWWRLTWTGLIVWLIGVPLGILGYLIALERPLADAGTLLAETRTGAALIASGVTWLAAALGLLVLSRIGHSRPDPHWALALVPGLAAAGALLAASWSGHASSGNDQAIGIAADALHNWGAALWLGGLAALALWLPRARSGLSGADRTAVSAAVVVRFSTIAIVAVTVLVVTGIYRALAELPSLADLVESDWGVALSIKLILFVALLALGGYNRLVLHPRLERAALGLSDSERGATGLLVKTTSVEILLGVAVMVAAAFLVVLPVPAG